MFSFVQLNSERSQDPSLPGWLKFSNGEAQKPSPGLIQAGINIKTVDCEGQEFSADTGGLNTEQVSGDPTNLVLTGN